MTCSAADLSRRWGDVTTCETREKLACQEGLAAPTTGATPATTDACAAALGMEACDAFLSGVMPPPECLPQMGPRDVGAACGFNAQCKSAFCATAPDALCGTCQTPPAAGASCATAGCGPEMTCVKATEMCQVPVASGGACSRALPCGANLSCVGATITTMGSCVADAATVGASCDPARRTGPGCSPANGLVCDNVAKQCVVQPVAPAGMPCGLINNVETGCEAGATCSAATGQMGTCIAPAADGAACDATNGPNCETPARCVAGTCQLPGSQTCS